MPRMGKTEENWFKSCFYSRCTRKLIATKEVKAIDLLADNEKRLKDQAKLPPINLTTITNRLKHY